VFEALLAFAIIICIIALVLAITLLFAYTVFNPKYSYLVAWRFSGKGDSRHITCVKARCAADAWKKVKRKATLQGNWEAELLDIRRIKEEEF
jgi:hypothetical protein